VIKNLQIAFTSVWGRVRRAVNPVAYARSLGVRVGKNCRLIQVDFGSEPYLVELGDHVSATCVHFITHDGGVWVFRNKDPGIDIVAPIKVGNNVFLGYGAIILPGVIIGDNVVVAAGAVVSKNMPANSVIGGVPARKIKSLEEYWESVQRKRLNTKGLSKKEKKVFYLNYFGLNK